MEKINKMSDLIDALENDKIVLHSLSKFPFEIKLVDISIMNDDEKYKYIKWQADSSCIM